VSSCKVRCNCTCRALKPEPKAWRKSVPNIIGIV
jgi:hypothetical protein